MEIQWFTKNAQGIVTIYETNITLNTVAASNFTNAYATLIGYNKKDNTLLIRALNKEEALNGPYKECDLHQISVKPSYGRINGKAIVSNIGEHFTFNFFEQKLYKFRCSWDGENKYLIVYLKEEIK